MSRFIETKAKPMNSHAKLQIAIEALEAIADTSRVPDGGRADVARTALKQIGEIDKWPTIEELKSKLAATEQCADHWRNVANDALGKPSSNEVKMLQEKLMRSINESVTLRLLGARLLEDVMKDAFSRAYERDRAIADTAERCAEICERMLISVDHPGTCAAAIRAEFRTRPSGAGSDGCSEVAQPRRVSPIDASGATPSAESADGDNAEAKHGRLSSSADGKTEVDG